MWYLFGPVTVIVMQNRIVGGLTEEEAVAKSTVWSVFFPRCQKGREMYIISVKISCRP